MPNTEILIKIGIVFYISIQLQFLALFYTINEASLGYMRLLSQKKNEEGWGIAQW